MNLKTTSDAMQTLSIILWALVIWWIAFAICAARDQMRQPKPTTSTPPNQSAASPESEQNLQPRWPASSECRAQPRLFLGVIGAALIYGTCLLFIWPAVVVHRVWRSKRHDHVA